MPSDLKIADTQAWLIKAQRDLTVAQQLLKQNQPMLDAVVYHCQQAGEKALKGYLFWHDLPFRKTHNLLELLDQCLAVDASLESVKEIAILLTPFATQFRYPGDAIEPPLSEAADAVARAKFLLAEIMKRLPEEVAPSDVGTSA